MGAALAGVVGDLDRPVVRPGKLVLPSESTMLSLRRRTTTWATTAGAGSTPAKRCGSSISSSACHDSR
jgi:hypothetical protein